MEFNCDSGMKFQPDVTPLEIHDCTLFRNWILTDMRTFTSTRKSNVSHEE